MRVIQTFQDFSSAEMLCRRGGLEELGEDQLRHFIRVSYGVL
jgi:hypothetical protein